MAKVPPKVMDSNDAVCLQEPSERRYAADGQVPEARILCLCARTEMTDGNVRELRALCAENPAWDHLLDLARWHRLVPLLYWNLRRHVSTEVPAEVLTCLKQEFNSNLQWNLHLFRELWRLSDLFEAAGVEIIPFKGPLQAEMIYGNIALRPSGDLDILVRPRQFKAASLLLEENEYSSRRWSSGISYRQQQLLHRFDYHSIFFSEAKQITVEIHWKPASALLFFPKTTDEIFEDAERVRLAGRLVRAFSLQDLLLFLCIHGSKHKWSRLEWVTGVAECLRTMKEAGIPVSVNVSGAGARRALLLGLSLADRLLEYPLDPPLRRHCKADPVICRLVSEIEASIWSSSPSGWRFQWRKRKLLLALCENKDEKAWFLRRALFWPCLADIQAVALPRSLTWLYVVVHPVRLGWGVVVKNVARLAGR